MKKQLKAALAAILAAFMALAVFPVSALPRFEAEKSPAAPTRSVPEGYNSNDYYKCLEFLEHIDDEEWSDMAGIKNGEILNENYDPDDPQTWRSYSDWFEEEIGFFFEREYGEYRLSSVSIPECYLCGALDLSDCSSLRSLDCSCNCITELNLNGCYALEELNCCTNSLKELDLFGCSVIILSCLDNPLKQISGMGSVLPYTLKVEGTGYIGLSNWYEECLVATSPLEETVEEYFYGWYTDDGQLISTELELSLYDIYDRDEGVYYDCEEIIAKFVTVRDLYDVHDYNKVLAFLEQTDENGVKNGVKLDPEYDPDDPNTFGLASWSSNSSYYGITDGKYHLVSFTRGGIPWSTMNEVQGFLDLSGCEHLRRVEVGEWASGSAGSSERIPITGVDVSGCGMLEALTCRRCRVEEIDLSGCSMLKRLNCSLNRLSQIDLSDCCNLETLDLASNPVHEIDLTPCKSSLSDLWIGGTSITELDLSGYTNLQNLVTQYARKLANLNLSGCSSLVSLYSIYNGLEQLDISGCTALESVNMLAMTGPAQLDFSDCPNLKSLETNMCMTELNISTADGIYYDFVRALGDGTFCFRYDGNFTQITAYTLNGSSFLGWYNEAGELLSSNSEYNDHADKVIIARFTVTKLPAPETVETSVVDGKPVIEWSEVDGAESYQVWRKTEGGEYELLASVAETSYTDSSAVIDTVYAYKICAVDSEGEQGNFSEEASITAYMLMHPTDISAQLVDTRPTITWTASEHATSYIVYRGTSKNGSYKNIGTVTGTTFVDTASLTPLKTYYYKIKAADDFGNISVPTDAVSITAYGLGVPTDVCAQLAYTLPTITWTAAENATSYIIYRSTSAKGSYKNICTVTDTTFVDPASLTPLKTYYYKIKAADDFGNISAPTDAVSITAYGIPVPADIGVEMVNCKPVVTWSSAENAIGYQVWRAPKSGSYELIATVNGTNFIDEDELTPLKTYYYKVKAFDDYGNESLFSAKAFIRAYGLAVPKGVKAALVDCKPLIAWNAVEYASGYQVWRMLKGGSYELIATVSGTSYFDGDTLVPQKTYYYKIKAIDEYGNESKFSSAVTITSYSVSAPMGVSIFMLNDKPLIAWEPVSYAANYQVWRMLKGGEYELVGTVNVTSFMDNAALTPGATYYYKVLAVDGYGNESAFSSAVSIVIPN